MTTAELLRAGRAAQALGEFRIAFVAIGVIALLGGHLVWIPIVAFPLALGIGHFLQKQ